MNNARRKEIATILEQLREIEILIQALPSIRDLADAEREAYDNMPEGLQNSERGQQADAAATALETAADTFESVETDIASMIDDLTTAEE